MQNSNLNKHVNCKDTIRTLMKQNLKMTYTKLVGKNNAVPCKFKFSTRTFSTSNKLLETCSMPLCNVKVSLFFRIQTLDNHCNSKFHKSKNKLYKKFSKEKTQNKGKFMDSSLKLWYYKEPSYNITKSCIQRMNIAKLIFRKIKKT